MSQREKNIFNHGKKISILYMILGPKDTIVFTKNLNLCRTIPLQTRSYMSKKYEATFVKKKLLELKSIYLTCVRVVFLENLKKLNFIKSGKSFMLRKLEL